MPNISGANNQAVTLKIMWFAYTASMFILAGVPHLQQNKTSETVAAGGAPAAAHLVGPLSLVALILGIASIFLYRRKLSAAAIADFARAHLSLVQTGVDLNEKFLIATIQPRIICWALNEAVVILGLVLVFTNNMPNLILPFFFAGVSLNILMYPRSGVK